MQTPIAEVLFSSAMYRGADQTSSKHKHKLSKKSCPTDCFFFFTLLLSHLLSVWNILYKSLKFNKSKIKLAQAD